MEYRRDISRIGCFGSLAKGTWGFGSDIDIIIVLAHSNIPPLKRSAEWDTTMLPAPTDLLVFTEDEIRLTPSPKFKRVLENEAIWVTSRKKEFEA